MFKLPDVPTGRRRLRGPGTGLGLTFQDSLLRRVHGWYPYVEGFSADYVEEQVLARGGAQIGSIYDPFGGSGTAQLVAACMGIPSFYSEINPLMAFVAETKIASAAWCRQNMDDVQEAVSEYLDGLSRDEFAERAHAVDLSDYHQAFPDRDFFEEQHLQELLACRDLATELVGDRPHLLAVLVLACVANAVGASNMTRRADLRRRRPDEYKNRIVDVRAMVATSIRNMVDDISYLPEEMSPCRLISEDCRELSAETWAEAFDFAITSPPYLNGTNYFRNTKIELWLMGMIAGEQDLSRYRARAITAGINNVSGEVQREHVIPEAESVAVQLDRCAKDRRIPKMVRRYFSDMTDMFTSIVGCLRPGAEFVLDIGDSRFYGVHVPTDRILARVGAEAGFELSSRRVIAERRSRDKTPLSQVELTFRRL
ncbi:MAG TPA: hypothetical protein VFN92_11290 [Solirubrobacterales bacterium]|nr:hypothetical protein [Solirubrobacterales bacterium]